MIQNDVVEYFLSGLMRRYQLRVSDVSKIIQHMVSASIIEKPADIENDHIAFRTLRVPHLGIASLEKVFLHHGFQRQNSYDFATKKLNAYWYSPPTPDLPRVFISELRVDELSRQSRLIVRNYTDSITSDPVDQIDLNSGVSIDEFLHTPLWPSPTWREFQLLANESEYAAWAIYNRYYLNHFTVSIHNLPPPWNTLSEFNRFLKSSGFKLNDSGGDIKTSSDGLLAQSSTVAQMVDGSFATEAEGNVIRQIPGSYVEFAERRVLPEFASLPPDQIQREHRREGFEASNADKIFESTYSHQTQKLE